MRRVDFLPWGIAAGLLGAAVVAVFFLIVDLAAGRPLATPTALGATLFLGEPFDLSRAVEANLVVGYTAVHLAVFAGLAAVVAALLLGRREAPPLGLGLAALTTLALFAGTSLLSLGFRALSGVSIWTELGVAPVTTANALAALAMAAVLCSAARVR